MAELDDAQLLTIVQQLVEKHGCKLVNIDFDTATINIEGSDSAKGECARALVDVLG